MLFADDTLFFCKTNPRSVSTLLSILSLYEQASGQRINPLKSGVTFSNKMPQELKDKVQSDLGIEKEGGVGKYLGVPKHFGRKKRDLFTPIVDRIRHKASSWSRKHLSMAGKMFLLKDVLSAIPNHSMQCFKLPQSLCKRIQSALTRFWWDSKEGKRGMSLVAWDTMIKSKRDGGLGFRDIQSFNDALLAKISWRILSSASSLLASVLAGKYFHNQEFLHVKAPSACSHGWRGILIGRDLINEQLGWAIGNGESVSVWNDQWLYADRKGSPIGPAPESSKDLKVADLFREQTRVWDSQKIEDLFPLLQGTIMSIKPSKCGGSDKRIWLNQSSGQYTAKSGYFVALQKNYPMLAKPQVHHQDWIQDLWKIPMTPKIKLLIWKIKHGALPVGEVLRARQIIPNSKCIRCDCSETIIHLFFHCEFARKVWELIPVSGGFNCDQVVNFDAAWKSALQATVLPPIGLADTSLAPWIISSIWTARNFLIFQKRQFSAQETMVKEICDAKEWKSAQSTLSPPTRNTIYPPIRHNSEFTCRSDAAWKKELNSGGVAWSFYNSSGERINSHSEPVAFVISSLVAEGLDGACNCSAAWISDLRIRLSTVGGSYCGRFKLLGDS